MREDANRAASPLAPFLLDFFIFHVYVYIFFKLILRVGATLPLIPYAKLVP